MNKEEVLKQACHFVSIGWPLDQDQVLRLYQQVEVAKNNIAPDEYKIGVETMAKVFKPNGITNISDLQAVFDAVEVALSSHLVGVGYKTVEEFAAYLCDEFDFGLNPVQGASWPEHENDEGKRNGGYVRLQPSDVQAYARENAKRILAFLGLPASPGASSTLPTGGSNHGE